MELISASTISNLEHYARVFREASPFRHVVIDDFFAQEAADEILRDFPKFDELRARDEAGAPSRKVTHEKVQQLAPIFRRFDRLLQSRDFLSLMEQITGIPSLLYDPEYFGGGTHENLHGQELDPHVDFNYHPTRRWHRRLNAIVYLNQAWDARWGGALELHTDPWKPAIDETKAILPLFNRCVIFETNEYSWHSFQRINLPDEQRHISRKSFALYLYTRERPPEQTAPEHSTFYVHRPLPKTIVPGHTLSEQDVAELRLLLERRDSWIHFLYEREKTFSTQLARLRPNSTYLSVKDAIYNQLNDLAPGLLSRVRMLLGRTTRNGES